MLPYLKTFSSRIFTIISIFGLLFVLNPGMTRAAGEPDATFDAPLSSTPTTGVTGINSIAIQPADGKIIVAGQFYAVGKHSRIGIARLNLDGSSDPTFMPSALDSSSFFNDLDIRQAEVQPDGKILIAGRFNFQGQDRGLFRLNADGTPDTAFNNNPSLATVNEVKDFILQADGKILLAAQKRTGATESRPSFLRVNSSGGMEAEVSSNLNKIAPAPGGKIIAIDGFGSLARLNSDLSNDTSFQTTNGGTAFRDVAAQPDGKVIVVGSFTTIFGAPIVRIARFNNDGTIDLTFGASNPARPDNTVRVVKLLSNGKILIGGEFGQVNDTPTKMVAIVNADGTLDTSFVSRIPILAEQGRGVSDIGIQADGRYIADRYRLNADGSLDPTYSTQIKVRGYGYKVLVQPDNKILVGGQYGFAGDKSINGLARLNADGSPDTNFNQNVFFSTSIIRAIALQPDGKIIAGGTSLSAQRLNPNGTLDVNLGPLTPDVYDIKVLSSGKILVAGGGGGYVRRYNSDGSLDNTFNGPINIGTIFKMALQPDGKIIIVGEDTVKVRRLNEDGTTDPTFNLQFGGPNASTYDVLLQSDGKILIGGIFTAVSLDTNKKYLARLNADGTLDTSFQPPALDTRIRTMRVQPDGKILLGGTGLIAVNNILPGKIIRINPNGTLDPSFNNAVSLNEQVWSIDLQQTDNKIVVAGWFTRAGDLPRIGVARLLNASAPARTPFDFDGDGRSDLAVFRPSNGTWYIINSQTNSFTGVQFGANGDVSVPADYDGDGRTDVAVYRPADGTWYLQQSTAGFRAAQFGASGDIPVPGDFDGDGKANLAVFRPSTGSWYIARATGIPSQNFDTIPFGANGDKPIAGSDFDGDGRADVCVYRPSDGNWYRINSSTNQFVGIHFGVAEDKPVAADYDGDGKTDLAVFRPSDGVWYRINSQTDSFSATQFGISSDRPAPADYDGDGKSDLAVFRPAEGVWYLLRSTAGFTGIQFGANGDVPAPNSFVR